MVGERCGCDACVAVDAPGASLTDGYCAFCQQGCVVALVFDGARSHAHATRAARLARHGATEQGAVRADAPGNRPTARELVDAALRSMSDVGLARDLQAALKIADVVVPVFGPPAMRVVRAAQRRLRRRK
jgi:hypothetical protein